MAIFNIENDFLNSPDQRKNRCFAPVWVDLFVAGEILAGFPVAGDKLAR